MLEQEAQMETSYNDHDLEENSVTLEEIDQVAASGSTVECSLGQSDHGHQRVILVGFTFEGRLLEVGIEFLDHCVHVFHASTATAHYHSEFERG